MILNGVLILDVGKTGLKYTYWRNWIAISIRRHVYCFGDFPPSRTGRLGWQSYIPAHVSWNRTKPRPLSWGQTFLHAVHTLTGELQVLFFCALIGWTEQDTAAWLKQAPILDLISTSQNHSNWPINPFVH